MTLLRAIAPRLGYLAGVALIVRGVAIVSEPAAWCVAGLAVVVLAVVSDLDTNEGDGERGEDSPRPSD